MVATLDWFCRRFPSVEGRVGDGLGDWVGVGKRPVEEDELDENDRRYSVDNELEVEGKSGVCWLLVVGEDVGDGEDDEVDSCAVIDSKVVTPLDSKTDDEGSEPAAGVKKEVGDGKGS